MSAQSRPNWLSIDPLIEKALKNGEPIVGLESAVTTHGLPRPTNLELALQMESRVRQAGALPATIALIEGKMQVGLTERMLETLAQSEQALKVNRRDLAPMMTSGLDGGTTVSATMAVARAAGLRVIATGGIGGVHRGDGSDVSADLPELARTQVAVVCSGAKVILDLPRTLEWLETAGVPVIGWKTDEFPAFVSRSSGLPVSWQVEDAEQVASILDAHWTIDGAGGVLICVPCPADVAVPWKATLSAVEEAEQLAAAAGVRGKDLTPYLLSGIAKASGGDTIKANLALLKHNAQVAAEIAAAMAA